MRLVFVILHYLAVQETKECISSIKQNVMRGDKDIVIVVVDNNSPDDSYDVLVKEYGNDECIRFIRNESNLGYARGNNEGFKYAKETLDADFIVLLNNDTRIEQQDWIDKIEELYNRYHYAVLGPNIVTTRGEHQNPVPEIKWDVRLLRKARLKKRVKIVLIRLGIDSAVGNMFNRSGKKCFVSEDTLDVELHGSCLIFSKEYIEMFDGLCDETFMYMEEDILLLSVRERGLKTLYSPSLFVYHEEDASTNASIVSPKERRIMKCREWIKSSYVYEKMYRTIRMGDNASCIRK